MARVRRLVEWRSKRRQHVVGAGACTSASRGRDWSNSTAAGNRAELRSLAERDDLAPGTGRVSRRRRGRLGQPRAARRLRAPRLFEGPRADRRHAGLVDRLLRRRRARRAARAWRRPSSMRRSTTPRAHGATTLEAYPVDTAGGRIPAATPFTARSRCSKRPASRSSSGASTTPPARSVRSSDAGSGSDSIRADLRHPSRAWTSSSVRVDTAFAGPRRLPTGSHVAGTISLNEEAPRMMTTIVAPPPMRCA